MNSWGRNKSNNRGGRGKYDKNAKKVGKLPSAANRPKTVGTDLGVKVDSNAFQTGFVRSQRRQKVKEVVLDGLVVLRIIKHCREGLPNLVAGSLLGLDVNAKLEVTNSFAIPVSKEDDEYNSASAVASNETNQSPDLDGVEYQMEIMKKLAMVNIDNNCIGWYRSTYLGSFISLDTIDMQYTYQETLANSVCVVLDPFRTKGGTVAIKAFRLSEDFMKNYKEKRVELEESGQVPTEVLEEIPIRIHNSTLINAFLCEMHGQYGKELSCDFSRLNLSMEPFLEKNLENLLENIDKLASEMDRIQQWQRQSGKHKAQQMARLTKLKLENEERKKAGLEELPLDDPSFKLPSAPNRLESLLVESQIQNYCSSMNSFTGQAFSKLFLASSLQKT